MIRPDFTLKIMALIPGVPCVLFDVLDVVCVGQFGAPASEDHPMDPAFLPIPNTSRTGAHVFGAKRDLYHVTQSCADRIMKCRAFSVHHGQCWDQGPLCAVFESWRQDSRRVAVMV